jgi:hypothetical protein
MQPLSESGKRRSKCALDYVSKVVVRIMQAAKIIPFSEVLDGDGKF